MLRKYGWRPDKKDPRDLMLVAPPPSTTLPKMVDNRKFMPRVYDQGQLGSCTANAIAANVEFDQIKQGKPHYTLSRLALYYNERVMEGTVNEDAGAMIRDGIKSLNKYGFCDEKFWPYDVEKFTVRPPKEVQDEERKNIVSSYARVAQSSLGIRGCLAANLPVVFGFTVKESFESPEVAKSGIMPMPKSDEQIMGGHAVIMAGYDDTKQMFLVRNSWGAKWGQNGYFWMPYDYALDHATANDFWVVKFV